MRGNEIILSKHSINGVLTSLCIVVPEFSEHVFQSVKEEEGYFALEWLADFLKDLIDNKGSVELVDRCYHYVNNLLSLNIDKNIEEWVYVTFLESMIQGTDYIKISREKLHGKAFVLFEEMINSGDWKIDKSLL